MPFHKLVLNFILRVSKLQSVYARLKDRLPVLAVSDTLVPHCTIKTVALLATTDKK